MSFNPQITQIETNNLRNLWMYALILRHKEPRYRIGEDRNLRG